jgi:hypothetical protein
MNLCRVIIIQSVNPFTTTTDLAPTWGHYHHPTTSLQTLNINSPSSPTAKPLCTLNLYILKTMWLPPLSSRLLYWFCIQCTTLIHVLATTTSTSWLQTLNINSPSLPMTKPLCTLNLYILKTMWLPPLSSRLLYWFYIGCTTLTYVLVTSNLSTKSASSPMI